MADPSGFNPDAPIVTEDDIKLFRTNPVLKANLQSSFNRWIYFLGLQYKEKVEKVENYNPLVFQFPNHNWMRITRVLKSLMLLGCEEEAKAFYAFLKDLHENEGYISDNSFSYFTEAVNGLVEM